MKTPMKTLIVIALLSVVAARALTADGPQMKPLPAATNPPAKAKLPRLVDVGAGKCIPCKKMAPILEELKREQAGKLDVEFIDVWKDPEAGKPYKIRMIPTQIFYDANGKELFRHEGFYGKADILAKWQELGVELRAKK